MDAVLDGLETNPALPGPMIHRLLSRHSGRGHVAKRADLTDALIEAILASGRYWLLHSLALNRHLPPPAQRRLAAHPDPTIRLALATHAAPGTRALLREDPDPAVREAAGSAHAGASPDLAPAPPPDPATRTGTSHPAALTPPPAARLTTDLDLAARLAADPDLAARLAADPDPAVRREVAMHPALPAEIRDRLAGDVSARVTLAVFARPDTPGPIRRRIHDALQEEHGDLLANGLNDAEIDRLLDRERAVLELEHLHLPWVTADPLPHVASPYPCFRRSAARATGLPADVVRRLLDDGDNTVRLAAARRAPHLVDLATAERLERDYRPRKHSRWRPADDFPFPAATLRRFAADADARMRVLAVRDPDLPAEIAARLAADPDPMVRRCVADHPRLPTAALLRLLDDPDARVVRAAAAAPGMPVSEMDRRLVEAGL
ncbi:hypothetical protein [Catenuloplanes indicus]|uniref:Leucine rich repeat variant n=1 Tax=Catenuloplanes indicus TaxID=137267 RepID=A0AAE3W943_9ACTN|nr:hypothetical protein [Catenuloplanes indicus]MDQ0370949.1 hypothetical protein [Catenuloplanes indicus]